MADNLEEKLPVLTEEELSFLKNSRAGYRGSLTKKQNEITLLMCNYTNLDEVTDLNNSLSGSWSKFAEAHRKLAVRLDEEQAIEEASKYYEETQVEMVEFDRKLAKWINEAQDKLSSEIDAMKSASNIGQASRVSQKSVSSSLRLKKSEEEAARRAAEIRLKKLEEENSLEEQARQVRHKLAEEEHRLKQKEKLLQAKAEVEICKAREEVFEAAVKEASLTGSKARRQPVTPKLDPQAASWIPRETPMSEPRPSVVEDYMRQASAALFLPRPEVPIFKGDPLEYSTFLVAFKTLIEDKTANPSSRLHYLVQYTGGDVQELVRSCLLMEPSEGYTEALRLLKSSYGQNYRIATAYVDRIAKGQPIKSEDINSLRKFSTLLTSCNNTLKTIGYQNKIENPDAFRSIVGRLPFDLRRKWRNRADHISEVELRDIRFEDFVKFIQREVRSASHPIFGDISSTTDCPDKHKKDAKPKASSFATVTAQSPESPECHLPESQSKITDSGEHSTNKFQQKCSLCAGVHRLAECPDFLREDANSRSAIVKKIGVCFNCLIPRHMAKDCRNAQRCTHCGRKHSSLLHKDNTDHSANTSTSMNRKPDTDTTTKQGCVGAAITETSGRIGLPVVTVKVKARNGGWVSTNAFLDSGSNMTFCTKALVDQLGVTGKKSCILLTTLDKTQTLVEGEIFTLLLQDNKEDRVFAELSSVMCRPDLPITRNDIPTQIGVDQWPHLEGISLHSTNDYVGLLIGNDHAELLQPLEVRNAGKGEPYAVRTKFGWTVNGPLGRSQATVKSVTANYIRGDSTLSERRKLYKRRKGDQPEESNYELSSSAKGNTLEIQSTSRVAPWWCLGEMYTNRPKDTQLSPHPTDPG